MDISFLHYFLYTIGMWSKDWNRSILISAFVILIFSSTLIKIKPANAEALKSVIWLGFSFRFIWFFNPCSSTVLRLNRSPGLTPGICIKPREENIWCNCNPLVLWLPKRWLMIQPQEVSCTCNRSCLLRPKPNESTHFSSVICLLVKHCLSLRSTNHESHTCVGDSR